MKLVFVDMEKRHVLLFQETGVTPIAFEKIYTLKAMLKNEPIIYVSDAVVTNSSEITNLINSLKDNYDENQYSETNSEVNQETYNDPSSWNSAEEPLFIHPTSNKRILIPDMGSQDHNGNISGFTFQGYQDFQSLSYLSTVGFNESHLIHILIKNGDLEVVPRSQVEVLKASYVPYSPAQNYNKQKYAQKYNQHNRHENILVENSDQAINGQDSTNNMDMNIQNHAGSEFKGDDIIPINLSGGINFKRGGSGSSSGQYGNEGAMVE